MEENNYRSGLKNLNQSYRWALKDNKCSSNTIDDVCEEEQTMAINDCYKKIKELDREKTFKLLSEIYYLKSCK